MRVNITLDVNNDAFQDNGERELSGILKECARQVGGEDLNLHDVATNGSYSYSLCDSYGNTVGHFTVGLG